MPHERTFRLVSATEAPRVLPGTIMFLPPHDQLAKGICVNPELQAGAFNHPVIILSCPVKTPKLETHVEIAIMTSFHGTPIRAHLAKKGIKASNGTMAAEKGGYLRVVTASKPYALGTLKLRNGKGMKRDFSYVSIRKTYRIALGALALYGGQKEEVDSYRLTAHALKVLVAKIEERRGREATRKSKKRDLEEKVRLHIQTIIRMVT